MLGVIKARYSLIILILVLISFVSSETFSWEFDSKEDFFDGSLGSIAYEGLNPQAGLLEISQESSGYEFLWVANAADGTVSKINTETNLEVARYRTGNQSLWNKLSPSRTTVDKEGNAWVGNRRGDYTVIKIAKDLEDCVDKDGDGIETSTGPNDIKPWGNNGPSDECIMFSVNYWPSVTGSGVGPRAMATDPNGKIWVGIYDERSYYVLNSSDGSLITKILNKYSTREYFPYGAIIGRDGILWSDNSGWSRGITKINTTNYQVLGAYYIPPTTKIYPYVTTVSMDNEVYFSTASIEQWSGGFGQIVGNGYELYNQSTFDPDETTTLNGRGITIDEDGYIWLVAHFNDSRFDKVNIIPDWKGRVYKIDPITKKMVCKLNLQGGIPVGAILDRDYDIWVVIMNTTGYAVKVGENCEELARVSNLGKEPYTYSDATGAITMEGLKDGWWEITISTLDGQPLNWKNISWNETNPGNSALVNVSLNFSLSDRVTYLDYDPANNVNIFHDISGHSSNELTIRIQISKGIDEISPILNNLIVVGTRNEGSPGGTCKTTTYRTECIDGYSDLRQKTEWIGSGSKPASCIEGNVVIEPHLPCEFLKLPFFSEFGLITSILIIGAIYLIISKKDKIK